MQRVMIIGCGGSGKSTLARQLGHILGLPVHHLDKHFWKPGWAETPTQLWADTHSKICASPAWIMDGDFSSLQQERIEHADTIIMLDMPTATCVWGVAKRIWRYHGKARPDMATGCPEKFDRGFLRWIITFRRKNRPVIMERLANWKKDRQVFVFTSRKQVKRFLNNLREQHAAK